MTISFQLKPIVSHLKLARPFEVSSIMMANTPWIWGIGNPVLQFVILVQYIVILSSMFSFCTLNSMTCSFFRTLLGVRAPHQWHYSTSSVIGYSFSTSLLTHGYHAIGVLATGGTRFFGTALESCSVVYFTRRKSHQSLKKVVVFAVVLLMVVGLNK